MDDRERNPAAIADGVAGCFSGLNLWSASPAAAVARPAKAPSTQEADALIAKELNELSSQERVRVQEQLHGVCELDVVEEDPDIVEKRLSQMEDELQRIRKKSAYERALFLSRSYVYDRDFRLMFLHANDFHPRLAAQRMVIFFELKLELFGIDKLVRRIMLDDLNEKDKDVIREGTICVLPKKDQAGRTVLCYYGGGNMFSQVRSYCVCSFGPLRTESGRKQIASPFFSPAKARAAFYLNMVALEDIQAQRKGFVLVMYDFTFDMETLPKDVLKVLLQAGYFTKALPRKLSGIHFCSTIPGLLDPIISIVQLVFLSRDSRMRFRAHFGTQMKLIWTRFHCISISIRCCPQYLIFSH